MHYGLCRKLKQHYIIFIAYLLFPAAATSIDIPHIQIATETQYHIICFAPYYYTFFFTLQYIYTLVNIRTSSMCNAFYF